MTEPLISVAMITFNHAPYIARAIEGVVGQSAGVPFELVIGEDCSTDGTRGMVIAYQKKYRDIIRIVKSDTNVGMRKNAMRTIMACRGKYVAFCEGDDYWHRSDKLQKQIAHLETHPGCGLVHSDYDRYYPATGKVIHQFNHVMNNLPPDNLDVAAILRGGRYLLILTCTVLARRDLVVDVMNSDPDLYQSDKYLIADTSLWAEIAWRSKTHYINESLATYTVLPKSASKMSNINQSLIFGKTNHELFLYLVKKYNLPPSEYHYHMDRWCEYSLRLALEQKDRALAEEVRKKKRAWSIKEWLWYLGARNKLIHAPLMAAAQMKRKYF